MLCGGCHVDNPPLVNINGIEDLDELDTNDWRNDDI